MDSLLTEHFDARQLWPFSARRSQIGEPAQSEEGKSMKAKKTLLIVAAMILTIAAIAVLGFVRSKMESNDSSSHAAASRVAAGVIRAA
jgi:flagellar basal body-associated protein FliL